MPVGRALFRCRKTPTAAPARRWGAIRVFPAQCTMDEGMSRCMAHVDTTVEAILSAAGQVHYNLSTPALIEHALRRGEGRLAANGALVAETGKRSEEHTSELQSREKLVCRLLLEKKKKTSS